MPPPARAIIGGGARLLILLLFSLWKWAPQTASAIAVPNGLYATVESSNQIHLTWHAVTDAVTYNVRRATSTGGPYTVIATNVSATNYSDLKLTASTRYYYVVSAVDGAESADSAPASAMTGSVLRLRVVISTDFPPTNVCMPGAGCPATQTSDPDDVQSMVRWLLYVNEFDVEGLVASSGTFANVANKTNILNMLDLYAAVHPNLVQHDVRYPTADALRAVTYQGRSGTWGGTVANNIGAGKDSEASEAIISIVDKNDSRPVWFCVWGDCSDIAQAIWKVQNTRSAAALQTFLSKIRIHQIAHQDDTIDWLMTNFPDLFIIYSGATYQGMFGGSDPMSDLAWVNANIRTGHGPLGAIYPPSGVACSGVCEGDTPSFLHLVSALRGLNDPEDPTQPSWGGMFSRDGVTRHYVDCCGGTTISKWRPQFQAEFSERADWMLPVGPGAPAIGVSADWLAARSPQGLNAPPVSFAVSNAGTGTLNYTVTNEASWLAVSPMAGSASDQAVSHTVSFITSNLPPGAYSSRVAISAPDATPSMVTMPVAVRIQDNGGSTNYSNPNTPLISVSFDEGGGTIAINRGSAGGNLIRSTPVPVWSDNAPAGVGGAGSVDFQTTTGNYYVESPTNYPQLAGLTRFTVTGWANCRNNTEGSGGNRLVTWINSGGDGVDIVYKGDGSVQVGINQWPDGSPARSSAGKITTDANGGMDNWRFFAVTYDSTLASGQVKFYFGSSVTPAALDVSRDYSRGAVGWNISRFCIGHFNISFRNSGLDRMFRGLIDEVQVYNSALTLDEIRAVQSAAPPLAPGLRLDALDRDQLLLTWTAPGVNLAEATNVTGPWTNCANQAEAQLVEPAGETKYYRLQSPASPAPPPKGLEVAKPRVINTTDLGADVDDRESLVRLMVTANEYDLEGLIGVSSCWYKNQTSNNVSNLLNPILNAYGQVLSNLQVHASGYPSLAYLRSISVMGNTGYGMAAVGAGKDSPGSDLIIAAVDRDDPRPVWVNLWGGGNTLAQALWKVRNTRSQAQVEAFVSKLRVYDILGQDDAGAWMTKTFSNLFYIRFGGVYNWQPSDGWIDTNIQNKGPLGAVYPDRVWATEGDTPSFLYEYPNGLSDPEHVDWGGWGGRCDPIKKAGIRGMSAVSGEAAYDPYYMYGDALEGGNSIGRWSTAINNDFAARMIWSVTPSYSGANHPPIAIVDGTTNQILQISASAGSSVPLNAVGSYDPDGDELACSWLYYREPSSYDGTVTIQNSSTTTPTILIPSDAGGKTLHVILELSDNGSPKLYAYRRVIINVVP